MKKYFEMMAENGDHGEDNSNFNDTDSVFETLISLYFFTFLIALCLSWQRLHLKILENLEPNF